MAGSIQYIKIARIDGRGVDITNTLESLNTLIIPSASVNLSYTVANRSRFSDYYLYNVVAPTNTNLSTSITSSVDYNITITPKKSNNVGAVLFTPMPISLGTVNADSLNLIQSSPSSINPTAGDLTYFSPPTDLQEQNGVYIKLQGTASINGNTGTGLFEFVKGSISDFNAGSGVQVGTNVFMNANASASLNMEINTTINFGEVIYLRLRKGSNIFLPTDLTFSQDTFLQITSSVHNGSTKSDLVLEPFFKSPFKGTDCDVLAGNAFQPVSNPFLQDIDYGNGSITPVNNAAIINGTAARGTVPESYYTALSSINLKYNGSKNESSNINAGQTPSITLNQSLVAYVDFIKDATPIINGKSIANIKYLINENGDAISPNLSETTVTDVQHNFEDNKEIDVSLVEPPEGTGMQILNGVKTIIRGGYRVEPILYTQTSTGESDTITMETSSLTPVLDVRSENKDTLGPNYFPNANVGHIYQFNQENSTLPGRFNYDHTTGKYTVNNDVANSGVTLNFRTQLRGGVGNFISGQGTQTPGNVRIQIIHDKTANGGGLTVIGDNNGSWTPIYFDNSHPPSEYGTVESPLVTGTVASGEYTANDTFYVKINVNLYQSTSYLSPITILDSSSPFQYPYFDIGSTPSPTGIDPITGSIWGISGSLPSSTISSSNNNLLLSYNILKQQLTPNSGMDETQQLFTVQIGDQFKFEDDESKIYEVISVIEPSQNVNNELIITFNRTISSAITLDYFLIRRFAPDGSSIIFDEIKPGTTASGPAFIKPRFTTNLLNKDIDAFIQDLKSKNLLT